MRFNILKFLPFILGMQKRVLELIYRNNVNDYELDSKRFKTYISANTTVELKGQTEQKAQQVAEKSKKILKKLINDPKKILEFIEAKGTKVIKAPFMDKVLLLIGEEEGFITPLKGSKALFLTIMINLLSDNKIPVGFKTPEIFAMRNLELNIYVLAHQFHHWMAYKNKMPGYEEDSRENFKNIWILDKSNEEIEKLSINDILSLRSAIARDIEAIDFVQTFTRELIGAKKSLDRIKDGQTVNI